MATRFDSAQARQRDESQMRLALDQAHNAWLVGEVPVDAVVVRESEGLMQLVATGYNRPITDCDPTAHAEIVALRHAAQLLGNYRLPECEVYVTLEPCAMCASALLHARVKRVVFGARDPKAGAAGSVLDVFGNAALNHHTVVEDGVLADACGDMLRSFFVERRQQYRDRHVGPTTLELFDTPESSEAPAAIAEGDVIDEPDPIPTGETTEFGDLR